MDAYLVFRALGVIAPHVPVRLGNAITVRLADAIYRRGHTSVRGLRDNIRHAMGASASPDAVDQAARRAFRTLLQNYFDMFHLAAMSLEQMRATIQIVNWDAIETARALGRGVLLCSAHLGHVEASLHLISINGLPVLAPAEHVQPERLYQYLCRLRTRHGLHLIPSDGSMREVFRALRRGEAVGLALDRDTTHSGVRVQLCGEWARVPDGYAHLAAKTRAPIVIGFCYRLPRGKLRAELGPVFVPDENGRREEIYRAALDFGVRELERAIQAHPDQWTLTTPLWDARA